VCVCVCVCVYLILTVQCRMLQNMLMPHGLRLAQNISKCAYCSGVRITEKMLKSPAVCLFCLNSGSTLFNYANLQSSGVMFLRDSV